MTKESTVNRLFILKKVAGTVNLFERGTYLKGVRKIPKALFTILGTVILLVIYGFIRDVVAV